MEKQDRKRAIQSITHGDVFVSQTGTGKRLLYEGQTKEFRIFEIPVDYLVLNVENGRIASLVKSFEVEHSTLDPEREEDAKIISDFLYKAHDKANDRTRDDIAKNGQLEAGIITSDGVIVDGNRRFSLMCSILADNSGKYKPNQKARCNKFRTVVLPEDADDKEILRLETSFQMGADEKVGYNAIEKYLHARDMKDMDFSVDDIAEYMGYGKTADVDVLLEVMELIDEYLDWCNCSGIYTRLPSGFEDDLLKLNTACKKIRRGDIGWIPSDRLEEVENDLKGICFDYIRLNMKSEDDFEFRTIASTANNNFLLNENVWKKLVEEWQKTTMDIEEEDIDSLRIKAVTLEDTKRLLDNRDTKWRGKVKDGLKDAYLNAKNIIENKKEKDRPISLIRKAASALGSVDLQVLAASSSSNKNEINSILQEIEKNLHSITEVIK